MLPDGSLSGKVFFGCNRTSADQPCLTAPGRPTPANPWKLFLLIEGAGLRIKLVGDVDVSESGQIHNMFVDQPQVPFTRLELNLNGGARSILTNPDGPAEDATPDVAGDCKPHDGHALLTGWADTPGQGIDKTTVSNMRVTPTNCPDAKPFAPSVDQAGSDPEQAGANTTSFIKISRGDGAGRHQAAEALAAGRRGRQPLGGAAVRDRAGAQAGNCPEGTKVGTIKTTVGSGNSLLTTSGSLYLAEPKVHGDAATLAIVVPAKAGPIDLGKVVVLNRVMLRASDTGIDASRRTSRRSSAACRCRAQDRDHGRSAGLLPQPDRLRAAAADGDLHVRRRPDAHVHHDARTRRAARTCRSTRSSG